MKKLITGAFVLALTIGAAQAQTNTPEKAKGHKKEHKMHKLQDLNLTEEQKGKLKTLHEEQKKEMQALKENKTATKEKRKELHQKYREQMQAVLTPAQKEQMAKIKKDQKASGKKADFKKERNVGRKGAFTRGDFQKELGLTQDQKDKMAKIRTDFRNQFETLRNDNTQSKEQKRTKMQDLIKAQQEQIKTVLTKEQIEKMQSLRKERSAKNTK